MEGGSSKVHKNSHMTNVGEEEEDMISSKLPESLISRILSLLSTKDAVRTCVLSKRWINRWASSITNLNIDDSDLTYNYNSFFCFSCQDTFKHGICFEYAKYNFTICLSCHNQEKQLKFMTMSDAKQNERRIQIDSQTGRKIISDKKEQRFVNFVGRALLLTNNTWISNVVLEKFTLVINNKRSVSLQNTWISGILNRRVKILRVHSTFYKLPFSALTSYYLFNSPSLEELGLVLKMFSTIKVPTISIHFGHLKFLKLYGIFFTTDSSSDCMMLCLPLLKKFDIKNCTWSSGKDLIVQAPLLESIYIEQDNTFCNMVSSQGPPSQSIKFDGSNLNQFTYCGCGVSQLIHLFDQNSLSFDSAEIIFKKCMETFPVSKRHPFLLLLFQQFHQVKSIKFESLNLDLEVMLKADIPKFSMLSYLELDLVTIEVLIGLLQNSPALKTLILKGIHKFAKETLSSDDVPHCLTYSLQVVQFEKVYGEKHELFLAKYLIENGTMIEELGFSLDSQRSDKSKVAKEFKEMVYPFKKRSIFFYCLSDY